MCQQCQEDLFECSDYYELGLNCCIPKYCNVYKFDVAW